MKRIESPLVLRNPMRSLYAKIFLWFCLTVLATTIVVLAVASFTGTQPLGRRWMSITQDLYAHSAVDFYRTGGTASLSSYLDTLAANSGIHGQLVLEGDSPGRDVLGAPLAASTANVLAQTQRTGFSCFRLGRVWSAAGPVSYAGTQYIFLMEVHPLRGIAMKGFLDGTFANTLLPRLILSVLLVALFCLLLARHITRPILILEDAAMQLANGALSVRASPRIAPRRDELAKMAFAFDRMAERIQGLISAQQEMLGHVSHELRSPLTRIGVSLELLRRGEAESLDQMQLDLDRMNQMIGEILEITRMDIQGAAAGQRTPNIAVDLAPLLESIAKDAAFEARQMQKQVIFDTDSSCLVLGDPALLRSCCENVVRNALLYTEDETSILIRLRCEAHAGVATISIEDQGPGVPEDALPRLFELFYRVGTAQAKHPDGTGFGLAIAQRIVAMHHGTIVAKNLSPHGLAIRIALPLANASLS